MVEDFNRLIGDWVIDGFSEMSGKKIPLKGSQKGYIDSDKKFVLESNMILDFGNEKTPWNVKIIQDQSKAQTTHEGNYTSIDDLLGESKGKTIFLPNMVDMVGKNENLKFESHMITYWMNEKESRVVMYQLDEYGHQNGYSEINRKPKKK